MEFKQLIKRAVDTRKRYAELEKKRYGRSWSREELMLGFVGDVGDLAKLVQAKEDVRQIDNVDDKLAHELCDCLWSVLVLANEYGVNLDKHFEHVMDQIDKHIENQQ